MTDMTDRIDALMKGAVDLHIHSGPSLHPRKLDHIAAVREADEQGMAAILLKDHYYPTMPVTRLINENCGFKTQAIGSIVLNNPLGGLNPAAVDYALKQGARVVWMATAHAKNHMDHEAEKPGFKFPQNSAKTVAPVPLTLTDENGTVRDEVKHILDLIAEADAVAGLQQQHRQPRPPHQFAGGAYAGGSGADDDDVDLCGQGRGGGKGVGHGRRQHTETRRVPHRTIAH